MKTHTKRIVAASAAAVVAASVFALPVSAASPKLKILTAPLSDIGADVDSVMGIFADGVYAAINDENGINNFISVDTAAWKETGEFAYDEINVNGDIASSGIGADANDYIMTARDSLGSDISRYYAYSFEDGEINITHSSENYMFTTGDGYVVKCEAGNGYATLTVVSPDGTSAEIREDNLYQIDGIAGSEKYAAALFDITNSDQNEMYDLEVILLTKDGKRESIYTDTFQYFGGINSSDGYVGFYTQTAPYAAQGHIFDLDTNVMYTIVSDGELGYDPTLTHVTDNIFIDHQGKYDSVEYYSLIKVDMEKEAARCSFDIISDSYSFMDISGDIILVEDHNGKWGYINTNGELLATFDDAGKFVGKYAPVVKDGKAFLINKNMKRVSEKIDANLVTTIDKDLYRITVGDEVYLATYASGTEINEPEDGDNGGIETAETVRPSDNINTSTTDSQPSTTTDDSKANPDTGAASAAMIIGLTAISGGALLLSRKRR